ncbi:Uncharacterised protein [Mycolicibacterium smegmatis]|nr:Uncharacterised protein [Mycolicibacterium smegmatis]SUA34798.1 Uncharacterised protein [Mycolicibacterium smegmatis]VTP06656.1 hypothetical protein BIN_B_00969 [Mycolicibacterium smegmatis]
MGRLSGRFGAAFGFALFRAKAVPGNVKRSK